MAKDRVLTVRVDAETYEAVKRAALFHGCTVSELVRAELVQLGRRPFWRWATRRPDCSTVSVTFPGDQFTYTYNSAA